MSWREASSLILLALKEKPYTSLYNYKMLMLKRSDKSSFMPNGYVFPGGVLNSSDANPKWLQLFKKITYSKPEFQVIPENLPPILKGESGTFVRKDLALRITAIRETFEETGVLLCRKKNQMSNKLWAQALTSGDLTNWRSKIQNDPGLFLELCETLECVPDVWGLKLWSNWLTPPHMKTRFDTIFHIACLPEQATGTADQTEVQHLEWYSPDRLLAHSLQLQLWLPPPQLYELRRIMQFCMLEDLVHFADERQKQGCELFELTRLKTTEGWIFSMPGDDLHGEVDVDRFKKCTFAQAQLLCSNIHRLENFNDGKCNIAFANVVPKFNHVLPLAHSVAPRSSCCKVK